MLDATLSQPVIKTAGGVSVALHSKPPYHVHPFAPEWRNWYTHQTPNLANFTVHVGSSPTSAPTSSTFRFHLLSLLRLLNLFSFYGRLVFRLFERRQVRYRRVMNDQSDFIVS